MWVSFVCKTTLERMLVRLSPIGFRSIIHEDLIFMDHEDLIFMDDGRETIIGRHSCGPETLGDMPVSKKTEQLPVMFQKIEVDFPEVGN